MFFDRYAIQETYFCQSDFCQSLASCLICFHLANKGAEVNYGETTKGGKKILIEAFDLVTKWVRRCQTSQLCTQKTLIKVDELKTPALHSPGHKTWNYWHYEWTSTVERTDHATSFCLPSPFRNNIPCLGGRWPQSLQRIHLTSCSCRWPRQE